jgi:hypothetical protein
MYIGQLCWSNQSLVQYVKTRVIDYLRSQPNATIISISQNDNNLYCKSTAEQAIYTADGALIGPLLRAVNAIADVVATTFPGRDIKVDTLAYLWTRQVRSLFLVPPPISCILYVNV